MAAQTKEHLENWRVLTFAKYRVLLQMVGRGLSMDDAIGQVQIVEGGMREMAAAGLLNQVPEIAEKQDSFWGKVRDELDSEIQAYRSMEETDK